MLRDRRVPETSRSTPRICVPAASCMSPTPHAGKTSPAYFFGFRAVLPPRDWHKMAYERRRTWAGFPRPRLPAAVRMCRVPAHQAFRCRLATGERSHAVAHGAVVGCIRYRFPGCFDVRYQCFRLQETLFLFMPLQISFVTANVNKL